MNAFLRNISALTLFAGSFVVSTNATAQAVQQGNGALVQKTDRSVCMTADLTGLSTCVNMNQTQYLITPSGNETSVWKGTVPAELRPAKTLVKDATWQERGRTFDTHSVTTPDGKISLTLHYKANGAK
ncbi:hypothetical protein FY528_10780 [Hymenobacter lutimineralis]|uniref:Lipocalin family protein n=1 Tax=Hymenobacter lutimineralis TaxID=2606448 RepID=A0A5D6V3Q7_9BACT|nr:MULTISPECIES: hypothetical protein [Hymenobacter]QIX61682.1 hypothetical protein HER32_11030 [Hymenobacter sp. BT18]TYZ09224.1 hypothetical protein FY528_10780 [Hymenobacter lutimineralis]